MAPNSVNFEHDPEKNILFTDDRFELATVQDVDEFIRLNRDQLERIGHKVWIVSKIDNLHIRAEVSEYYGQQARGVFEQYILGFARYGENPLSRMSVRTSARKSHLESNIYNTRDEAVAAIEKIKAQQGSGS